MGSDHASVKADISRSDQLLDGGDELDEHITSQLEKLYPAGTP